MSEYAIGPRITHGLLDELRGAAEVVDDEGEGPLETSYSTATWRHIADILRVEEKATIARTEAAENEQK